MTRSLFSASTREVRRLDRNVLAHLMGLTLGIFNVRDIQQGPLSVQACTATLQGLTMEQFTAATHRVMGLQCTEV